MIQPKRLKVCPGRYASMTNRRCPAAGQGLPRFDLAYQGAGPRRREHSRGHSTPQGVTAKGLLAGAYQTEGPPWNNFKITVPCSSTELSI